MKEIKLTHGKITMVDDEDYTYLSKWKWFSHKGKNGNFYAARTTKLNGRKGSFVLMHRVILGLVEGDGKIIDHINRDGLDNRKFNLRITTYSTNNANSKIQCTNTSGYRGVSWHKKSKKWQAYINVNSKFIYCGIFENKIDAALAHDKAIIEYRENDIPLNFPLEVS